LEVKQKMRMNPFKLFRDEISKEIPFDAQSYENARNYFASRTIAYESPMGCMGIVAADQEHISHVFFTDDFPFGEPSPIQMQYPVLTYAQELLDRYFAGEPLDVSVIPIRVDWGTDFQNRVWETIRQIPYGEVRSYKWIAEKVGRPKAVRAVGSAVGANAAIILNPCHRVIRSNGALGGYGGGLERKRRLLALEGYPVGRLR
jgi:methylated-DNA-[protein]-cysteine S-methyltransferase